MKIVKPTDIPSMAVVVDTIVSGLVILNVPPAHAEHPRVDSIFAGEGMIRILYGVAHPGAAVPAQPLGYRRLANIYVAPMTRAIYENNIVECE